jgi:long-subunit acyl-CoA synthetase (AMP-forming)
MSGPILLSVPRLYEKIYEAVRLHGQKLTGIKKKNFRLGHGHRRSGIGPSDFRHAPAAGTGFKIRRCQCLVYDKIRKVIGFDRLVVAGSGGAALSKESPSSFGV